MVRRLFAILFIVFCGGSAAGAQTRYLADLPDVPLPAGYSETRNAAVTFDKAQGRVVRTAAFGAGADKSGRAFYWSTLPELGWRRVSGEDDGDVYVRGSERLAIRFLSAEGGRVIEFALTPRG